ncbi:hypothetical protein TRVL_03668 [Trypanosoma vivax]|nr:hypothetical protein TRVL_03668 [Trypanosoma vivax]
MQRLRGARHASPLPSLRVPSCASLRVQLCRVLTLPMSLPRQNKPTFSFPTCWRPSQPSHSTLPACAKCPARFSPRHSVLFSHLLFPYACAPSSLPSGPPRRTVMTRLPYKVDRRPCQESAEPLPALQARASRSHLPCRRRGRTCSPLQLTPFAPPCPQGPDFVLLCCIFHRATMVTTKIPALHALHHLLPGCKWRCKDACTTKHQLPV